MLHPSPSSLPDYKTILNIIKQCNISYTSFALRAYLASSVTIRINLKNGLFVYLNKFLTKTMLNTKKPETNFSHKPHEFITQIMLNPNELEKYLSHKPRDRFVTQTMLNTEKPETHLSHKPRYKFATQTMLNINKLEIFFCLINHVINLSEKPH